MSAPRVRIAILGASPFTREAHVPAVIACGHLYEIVAVYNRSAQPAENLAADIVAAGRPAPEIYSGDISAIDAVLARPDVDAVSVVMASHIQPSVVKAALRAGKHVMCEKPVAHTVAVGKELLDEYNRDHKPKGVLWAVLENYRFEPGLLRAGELAATAIGKLAIAEIRFHTPIPAGSRFASHDRTSLMIEAGCHFTAGMRVLLPTAGRVVASAGFSYGCGSHLPSPDTLTAVYNFEGGVGATMAVALGTSIRKCEALLSGTAGCVEVRRCVQDGKHGYSVTTTGKDDEFHPFAGVGAAIQCFGQAVSMTLAGGKPLFDSRLTAEEALLDIQLIEDVVSTPLPMPDAPALPV